MADGLRGSGFVDQFYQHSSSKTGRPATTNALLPAKLCVVFPLIYFPAAWLRLLLGFFILQKKIVYILVNIKFYLFFFLQFDFFLLNFC